MRATFIRTTFAAALLAGATLTAACAVEEDGDDDALAEEAELDGDVAAETPTSQKALNVTLNTFFIGCNGVSPQFEADMAGASGGTYTLYMRTTAGGVWSPIHTGGPFHIWSVTGNRWYKAKGCKAGACDESPVQFETKRTCTGGVPL